MALGDEPVEIDPSDVVLREQYDMVGRKLHDVCGMIELEMIDVGQQLRAPCPHHLDLLHVDLRCAGRVVHGPVMMLERDPELLRDSVELIAVQLREQQTAETYGVEDRRSIRKSEPLRVLRDEAGIEARVVCDDHGIATPVEKVR